MGTFAALDIGTNSIRLAVVEPKDNLTWNVLSSQKQVVRLGDGEFTRVPRAPGAGGDIKHALTGDAIDRAALVCARFAEVARGFGATEIVALATAAVREAENREDFVERVRELADLDVRVISGQEEARLIYHGVVSGINLKPGQRALFMDIGGGSTELIVGDSVNHYFLDSLKLGAIRLTAEVLGDVSKPVTPAQWNLLQTYVRSALAPAARSIAAVGFNLMYGSSGTAQNLAEIVANAKPQPAPTSFRNYSLDLADIQAATRRLCAMNIEQRRRVPGINPERADIIIGGSAILQTVMETVNASTIHISDRGLREGIVVDRLLRRSVGDADTTAIAAMGARRRSIYQLMKATGVDDTHARHIVRLSLSLFDQWKKLGLHDYDSSRELLEYAALLHDCGFFISHTDHQQHSYYIIRHSELLGFNDGEVEIMACLALYHRKALPRPKHEVFARLDNKTRRVVRVLSCALRIAEALDRGHLSSIRDVIFEKPAKSSGIVMTLETAGEAQLELWAAQVQAAAFEKTFGLPLEVRMVTAVDCAPGMAKSGH